MTASTQYTYEINLFSDLHKEAYGCRPSENFWARLEGASPDALQQQWDYLLTLMEEDRLAEEERQRAEEAYARDMAEAAKGWREFPVMSS